MVAKTKLIKTTLAIPIFGPDIIWLHNLLLKILIDTFYRKMVIL